MRIFKYLIIFFSLLATVPSYAVTNLFVANTSNHVCWVSATYHHKNYFNRTVLKQIKVQHPLDLVTENPWTVNNDMTSVSMPKFRFDWKSKVLVHIECKKGGSADLSFVPSWFDWVIGAKPAFKELPNIYVPEGVTRVATLILTNSE